MGSLIKGVLVGLIGAVTIVPVVLLLALIGIPIFVAGAVVVGALVAIPVIIVAALSLPFLVLAALLVAAVAITVAVAVKVALFVVLPIAVIALAIGWLARTAQSRRATA